MTGLHRPLTGLEHVGMIAGRFLSQTSGPAGHHAP